MMIVNFKLKGTCNRNSWYNEVISQHSHSQRKTTKNFSHDNQISIFDFKLISS